MMKNKTIRPPRAAEKMLRLLFRHDRRGTVLSELEEGFVMMCEEKGASRAKRWYNVQVLKILKGKIYNTLYWSIPLFGSYIKIAFRNIKRQKVYSAINIAGLAIGIACCILVMLYVQDELSYDQFHENKDLIYRVTSRRIVGDKSYFSPHAPMPIAGVLKDRFPEVKHATVFNLPWHLRIQTGEKIFNNNYGARVASSFFEIFTFSFIRGDPKTALLDPASVVLTESFAKQCFGSSDAVGKTINISLKDRKVTGVIRDVPYHSHIRFDFAMPISLPGVEDKYAWRGFGSGVYVQFAHSINMAEFNKKIKDIAKEYDPKISTQFSLQPLDKVYLYSNFLMEEHEAEESGTLKMGNINSLYMLALTAFCILLIACMNFINLSTAMAGCRAKEIGVRKVCGSQRKDLIKQFLGESTIIAFLALIFALILVQQFLPAFNRLSEKQLHIQGLFNVDIFTGIIAITLFAGLISGSYPAFFLSSLQSVEVFKKTLYLKRKNRLPFRKVLVIFQFSIAIVIIICTTVFYRQVHFMQSNYREFDLDNTIVVVDWKFARYHESVKEKLLRHPNIIAVSQSEGPGNQFDPSADVYWDGKKPGDKTEFYSFITDSDFIHVFNPEMVAGRFFSKRGRRPQPMRVPEIQSQTGLKKKFVSLANFHEISKKNEEEDKAAYVLNETAAKAMGSGSPVGKGFSYKGKHGTIIGVMKDRLFGPFRYRIKPLVFMIDHKHPRFNIKVDKAENFPAVLAYVSKIRKEYPNYAPLSPRFAKDDLMDYYTKEQTLSRIFSYITFLAIFLACLGLLGLSAFHAERKTKEIGIRKVFGSSTPGIVVLLTKEFVKWILLANIISWIIAYYFASQWLRNYVYRVTIGLDVFVFAAVLVFAVSIITISYQAIKSAKTNPVEALRYE